MNELQRLQEIEAEVKRLTEEKAAILSEWARANCPLKVGDVVTNPSTHPHAGKQLRVRSIRAAVHGGREIQGISFERRLAWIAHAIVLRKDGTDSAQAMHFLQKEYERAMREAGI